MSDLFIFIPGITGSRLRRNGTIAWGFAPGTIGTAILSAGASLRDGLSMKGDDHTLDDLGDGVVADGLMPDLHLLPGFWKIDGYSSVSRSLCQNLGLTHGLNYFEFAYDWRRDNRVSARRLATATHQWLRAWRQYDNKNARVVFIAHSMGGLIARYFLEVLGGWEEGSARALITIGTPFRGSLNALEALANGLSLRSFKLSALTDLCRSLTSVYQLLPIFPAYDPGDGNLIRVGETNEIPHVDPDRARLALAFHTDIREAVRRNRQDPGWEEKGYATYPIAGASQLTNHVGRRHGNSLVMSRLYKGKELGGDGTVPWISAIPVEFDDLGRGAELYSSAKHGSLQNAEAVLSHVAGRIQEWKTDRGAFRSRPTQKTDPSGRKENIAIELADVVLTNEPVSVKTRSLLPQQLTIKLFKAGVREPLQIIPCSTKGDEWIQVELEPLPEGTYRVSIHGDQVETVAEEAFAVASTQALHGSGADNP